MYRKTWLFFLLALPALAAAQVQTLRDAAQQAVLSHPEVQSRWHAYKAAAEEREVAFGSYLPKVDLTAAAGQEDRNDPNMNRSYSRSSTALTLTQMLYDGFGTRSEVARLDYARRVRLFELQDTSETIALEAARAYLDVLRYRNLVVLAEDNYVRHRSVLEQIQQKVQAGVGRKVDLEQASGRLALAEANLLTETSNLHDVSARFQRLVGAAPGQELAEPPLMIKGLPDGVKAAVETLQRRHPALRAAIENVRSAQAAADVRKAAYQPRVDLRLKSERGSDLNGYIGSHATDTAEVVLTWNLFNGKSDIARSRQYAEQLNVARDLRDKTCRDTRQTLSIAYNDILKLREQLGYLDQHQVSIEKARDAYRKQFDIGQRTLLDLLDSENELFQAKRAYANAEYDLGIAHARAQAGIGTLLGALGLSRIEQDMQPEVESWDSAEEADERCPVETPTLYVANKAALDARAMEMLKDLAPQPPEAPSVREEPPAAEAEIAQAIEAWAKAWSSRDLQAYLDAYAPAFAPTDGGSRKAWAGKRKRIIERAGDIQLDIADVKVAVRDAGHAAATFRQTYRAAGYADVTLKTLEWEKLDGRWLIVKEVAKALPAVTGR
ncbi:MAG: TolC family outer membrane protein [Candidatus Nitricoxidivorans perseverans]|uniref:TolC family outer membrane protein n=1 Tax=Candidatus Nitricoxidivorans perseverans TaxID=2975601 RepID=A0AA49IZG8_9PROT|nr:MAG: TolC family outer membrane protein [Candidatus Nitricoxidivorans perseverans]